MLTFTTDGMVTQHFPFRASLMDYIFKNVQPQHLIKLYPCCKFFFAKFRKNIIQHLEIVPEGKDEVLDPTKTIIRASNPTLSKLVDFWITDSFIYGKPIKSFELPEFLHCSVKKLELTEYIYLKDYEILTKAGTVEELKIMKCVFIHNTNFTYTYASVDQVIGQVPNAKSIEICVGFFAVTTCASLNSLNHSAKISNIVLKCMVGKSVFNLKFFTEFIYKNTADNCNIYVDFDPSTLHFLAYSRGWGADSFLNRLNNDFTERIKAALEMKKNRDI